MYITGKIDPSWNNDFKHYEYQQGSYYQPLGSMFVQEDLDRWKQLGYTTDNILGYRHIVNELPEWGNTILEKIAGTNHNFCFFRMDTGNIIPFHKDVYTFYKNVYGLQDSKRVWRTIVFLDNRKPGHLFAIEDLNLENWSAGDYVSWNDDAYHMAANIGEESRYTLQITYIK